VQKRLAKKGEDKMVHEVDCDKVSKKNIKNQKTASKKEIIRLQKRK